jgi:predicted RNA-binding Zn ribbon-like protein
VVGTGRLGVCGSDPCRCVFVDRTRAGTRKYCCTYCNDRFAARAYRRRKKG